MTRASFAEILKDRTSVAGLTVAEDLVEPLFAYYELLSFWNRKINLTAVNLEELAPEGVDRLFIEPLSASRFAEAGINVIDIGSGGGSPAIPFSLAVHATSLTMIESRTRKSVFLQEAARATGLRTEVVTARYEEVSQRADLQGASDALLVRAVRVEPNVLRQLSQFVKRGGSLFLFRRQTTNWPTLTGITRMRTEQLTPTAVLDLFHVEH